MVSGPAMKACLLGELLTSGRQGVRVELQEGSQVLEGVLLQRAASLDGLGLTHDTLDLIGVDESGEVRVGHGCAWQLVALLDGAWLLWCACIPPENMFSTRLVYSQNGVDQSISRESRHLHD